MQVVTAVLRGRDGFAVLPTGYRKVLCYAVLPAVFDALSPRRIVIVLSPLTAIMKDQAIYDRVLRFLWAAVMFPYNFPVTRSCKIVTVPLPHDP